MHTTVCSELGLTYSPQIRSQTFFLPINNLSRFWLVTKKGLKIYMFYFFATLLRFFFFTYLLNWLDLIVYLAQPFCFILVPLLSNVCLNDNSECHFNIISWLCCAETVVRFLQTGRYMQFPLWELGTGWTTLKGKHCRCPNAVMGF